MINGEHYKKHTIRGTIMYHVINLDAAECCIILQYYFICVQGAPDNYNNALEQDFNNLEAR